MAIAFLGHGGKIGGRCPPYVQGILLKVKTAKSAKGLFLQNQQGVFPLCSSIIFYEAGVRISSVLLAILAVSLFSFSSSKLGGFARTLPQRGFIP